MATLSAEWIKNRKVFLSKEYTKVTDKVTKLRKEFEQAEDDLNDIVNEIADLDSLSAGTKI
jgi:predicted  nucleic acid-binding Zn-ribbon protein